MKKTMITASAFLFSMLFTTGAMAAGEYGSEMQQQGTQPQMEMKQQAAHRVSSILSADNLVGRKVENEQGQKLGKVEALLVDIDSGQIGYALVGDHPVPWHALQANVQNKTFTLNMSPEKLKEAPKGKSIVSLDEEQRINEFFGVAPYWEGGGAQPQMPQESAPGTEGGPGGGSPMEQ